MERYWEIGAIIWRQRWPWFIGVLLLFSLIGVLRAFTTPSRYEASSKLLFRAESSHEKFVKGLAASGDFRTNRAFLQPQREILKSHNLAQEAITSFQPANHGFTNSKVLAETLKVEVSDNSNVMTLNLTGNDRTLVPKFLNHYVDTYLQFLRRTRENTSRDTFERLQEKLVALEAQLKISEQQLHALTEKQGLIPPDEKRAILLKRVETLSTMQNDVRNRQLQIDVALQQLQSVLAAALQGDDSTHAALALSLLNLPVVKDYSEIAATREKLSGVETQIRELSATFKDKHPRMVVLLQQRASLGQYLRDQLAQISQTLGQEKKALAEQEQALRGKMQRIETESLALSRAANDYNLLSRTVESNNQLYQTMLEKLKQLDVADSIESDEAIILEPAALSTTVGLRSRGRNIAMGIFFGLFMAIAVIGALEFFDRKVFQEDDIERLGLPVLATVPLQSRRDRQLHMVAAQEAFRRLRTQLLYQNPTEAVRSVVIGSVFAAEGKSTTAQALAQLLAGQGLRTLLIDADLRRPVMHERIGVPVAPGFTEILNGSAGLDAAVVDTEIAQLAFLPSGATQEDAAELLSSRRAKQVLQAFGECFEIVVFDSSPLLLHSDPYVLAHLADSFIMVVRAGVTSQKQLVRALEHLKRLGVKVSGAVFFGVTLAGASHYYGYQTRSSVATPTLSAV